MHMEPKQNYTRDPADYNSPLYKSGARQGVLSTTGVWHHNRQHSLRLWPSIDYLVSWHVYVYICQASFTLDIKLCYTVRLKQNVFIQLVPALGYE